MKERVEREQEKIIERERESTRAKERARVSKKWSKRECEVREKKEENGKERWDREKDKDKQSVIDGDITRYYERKWYKMKEEEIEIKTEKTRVISNEELEHTSEKSLNEKMCNSINTQTIV